jgi:hypothetical protein
LLAASFALGGWGTAGAQGADRSAGGQSPEATCPAGGQCFADVPEGNAFYEFANRLYQQDIISGYPCGGPGEPCDSENRPYYRPGGSVTRQQMTKFVDQARQLPGIFINTATHGQPIYSRTTLNNGIGVFGESPNGIGLRGIGSPGVRGTSTGGRGVEGTSTNGFGVYGYSNSLSGVYGQSASTGGAGVFGANEANGASAAGVAGLSTFGLGVYGVSGSGIGVKGETTSGDDADAGVAGTTTASNGTGVKGTANNGTSAVGVWGESTTGMGVRGTSSEGLAVAGTSDSGWGLYGLTTTGRGVYAYSDSGHAVFGRSPNGTAGRFEGDVEVTGTCTGCLGPSRIDHPLDPENRYLQHAAVQSAELKNVYDGNVTTDANGQAVVTLPEWFEALNRDFRYQLTVIGDFAQAVVSSEIRDNRFTIKTDKPNVKVSWQVTGIRHDPYAEQHPLDVEPQKSGEEQGKYLHPAEWGRPETKGVGYETEHRIPGQAP